MLKISMKFRDYPMLGYFLNMFNATQPPEFRMSIDGPTTDEIPVTVEFWSTDKEPDCEALAKMCAAAYGTDFSVTRPAVVMEPQFPEIKVDGETC